MGRRLVPKEVRDIDYLKDQLIDALKKKNEYQDELISQLTEEIAILKETLKLVKESQRLEREPED